MGRWRHWPAWKETHMTNTNKIVPAKVTDAQVKSMVTEAREANESASVTVKAARIASSLALYVAKVTDRIGDGEGALWSGMEGFCADAGIVGATGKAPSSAGVTMLRRIGHAIALGFDADGKDSVLWPVLSSEANNSEGLRKVLDDESASLTAVRKAVQQAKADLDRKASGTGGKRGARTNGKGNTKADAATDTPNTLQGILQDVKALDVKVKSADLSADEWSKVEAALHAIITREVTLLAKASAEAAKPRKRTAKKTVSRKAA